MHNSQNLCLSLTYALIPSQAEHNVWPKKFVHPKNTLQSLSIPDPKKQPRNPCKILVESHAFNQRSSFDH